ncbi:YitT family ABC transporter [Williamsoniiplasma luminosum]|uniref:YitT family protein n=1 Tax=Williamsoniiplasma luminosum TaxID=214888 RepID=A0A2S0NJH7_9MOLU|nr:YitT family ABC transporter [Williamsoniiplasma luminosum]AVP49161.1 MAG: hypothetical protein C5T88_01005 [Williamsoniiplasma luminosum]
MRRIIIFDEQTKKKKTLTLTNEHEAKIKALPNFQKNKDQLMLKAQKFLEKKMYLRQAFWKDVMMVAFGALMTTIALNYFISTTGKTGLFPGGLGSITRFLAIISTHNVENQSSLYFVYYAALNIPLVIFGFWKLGFRFTLTTLLYILFSTAFDWIIRFIPVINPTEWHMIINYQLISKIPNEWNSAIWLFVFAVIGGLVLGASYALVYKIGSSSGGSDFLTMYFSTRKNKNIGSINRNLNFVILTLVVIMNTFLLKTADINEPIKLDVLNNLTNDQWYEMVDAIKNWAAPDNHSPFVPSEIIDLAEKFNGTRESGMQIASYLAADSMFEGYSNGSTLLMQFKFILGPSWFASVILIIVQSLVITAIYPKYKFRTIFISTTKPEDVKRFLFNSGYRNEVFEWESKMQSPHTIVNKHTLVITITVINWKALEKGVAALDPDMNFNVLRTRGVKGRENIELKTGKKDEFILHKIQNNKEWSKKIEDEAILKTIKEQNEQIRKEYKLQTKADLKANKAKKQEN